MPNFRVSQKARADLLAIGRFTEKEWGKAQRNHYLRQLHECFLKIAETPELGVGCSSIREGYRKFPQGSHVIFYRQSAEGTTEIIRVLHKSMDVDSNLLA